MNLIKTHKLKILTLSASWIWLKLICITNLQNNISVSATVHFDISLSIPTSYKICLFYIWGLNTKLNFSEKQHNCYVTFDSRTLHSWKVEKCRYAEDLSMYVFQTMSVSWKHWWRLTRDKFVKVQFHVLLHCKKQILKLKSCYLIQLVIRSNYPS